MFLREAYRDFQFFGGEIREILMNYTKLPETISEAVRIESSIHNCYKCIEAVRGGNLTSDLRKLRGKFSEKGVNLGEFVGYEYEDIAREPAINEIEGLSETRNFKSAHGGIKGIEKARSMS